MKSVFKVFTVAFTAILFLVQCSKKGDAIIEPNVASIKFTTFTVDTFKLKITVNDILITDTLYTPSGSANGRIPFTDSIAVLKIINVLNDQVFVDTMITLRPGVTTISLVQFLTGQRPFLPLPPNEVPPAAGNYKVRFQYIQPSYPSGTFLDSVECVIRLSSVPVDTIILRKYEVSDFYEAAIGSNFSMKIFDAETGSLIDNATNNLNSGSFTEFNTAVLYGSSPTNYLLLRIY